MSYNFIPAAAAPRGFAGRFIQRMCKLVREGDDVTLRKLLSNELLPENIINWGDLTGSSPLHVACGQGDRNLAEFLLANGANLDLKRSTDGSTAFHIACANGSRSLVRCLESHDPDFTSVRDTDGSSGLHIACERSDTELVRVLLSMGAEPNSKRADGCYPIQVAAKQGNVEIVNLLLAHGSHAGNGLWENYARIRSGGGTHDRKVNEVFQQSSDGSTTFQIACESGDIELVERMIAQGADVNLPRRDGYYPLHVACWNGDTALASTLISFHALLNVSRVGKPGYTPLLMAIDSGHFALAELLVVNDAQVLIHPPGEYPAHIRVLYMPETDAGVCLLRSLINHGTDCRWRDENGFTMTHISASQGSVDYMRCILHIRELDPNRISIQNLTPLHCAAVYGRLEIARMLLRHGVNPTVRAENGETALDIAIKHEFNDVARLLLHLRD